MLISLTGSSLKEKPLDIENVRSYYPKCSPVFVQQLSSGGSSGDGETVSADQVLDKIKTKVQLYMSKSTHVIITHYCDSWNGILLTMAV